MPQISEQDWRRERLVALVHRFGGKAALGRELGFRDGAYVGHMLSGERPITEKFVAKAHAVRGLAGWFNRPSEAGTHPLSEQSGHAELAGRIAAADPVTRRLIELALLESDADASAQLTPSLRSLVQAAKSLIKDVEDPR